VNAGTVDGLVERGVEPFPVGADEIPQVLGITGEHVDIIAALDEPADHFAAVLFRAADTGMIPMSEPGDFHPAPRIRVVRIGE
jgi:hypothetical protein